MSGIGWNDYNLPPSSHKPEKPAHGRTRFGLKTRTLVVLTVVALASATGVFAYFTSTGTGAGTANNGFLNAPAKPGATANGSNKVDVTWQQATLSTGSTLAQKYYISRYSGSTLDGYACGTSPTGTTIPASAAVSGSFTCTDGGLTMAGPYTYTVTAVYKSWTAESVKSDPVTVILIGPLDHFILSASTPVTAGAADNLTITAKDSNNQTITSYGGDKSLTFSGAGSIGTNNPTVSDKNGTAVTFGNAETITFTNGVATVSSGSNGVMRLYKAETASIVVSDGTHSNSGLSVTVSPAAANTLAFQVQPSDATAGQTITPAVKVEIDDQFGNLTSNTANVSVAPSAQTLSGTLNKAAVAGVATFSDLSMTKVGSYTLSASSSGLTGVTSNSFNISAGAAASMLVISGSGQSATVNTAFASPLVAKVVDAFGNPVSGASVTYTAPASGTSGTFANTTATTTTTTDSSGSTSVAFNANTVASGTAYNVSASASGAGSVNFILTNNPGAPASVVKTAGDNQAATVNTAFTTALKVTVKDNFNNPVLAGINVTFTAPGSGASGKFANNTATTTVATASDGTATATTFTANTVANAAAYSVSAVANAGINPSANFSLKNTPGAPASVSKAAGDGQSATVNTAFATALKVTVSDSFGNPVLAGINVTFTAPAQTGASGTFAASSSGTTSVNTAADGTATASAFTADTKSGTYSVGAQASGGTNPSTNFSETNAAGAAAQVAITPTPGSATASATTNISLALQLQDQFGNNTTSSGTTTLALSTSSSNGFFAATAGATGTATANVSFSTGVGTATEFYRDQTAATPTLTAKNGAATWGTQTVTITAAAAAKVAITPTPGSATASATTNISLALQLQDQFGNNTTSSGTTTLALTTSSANGIFATTNGTSGSATLNAVFSNGVGTAAEFYGDKTASASTTLTAKNGATTWGTTTVTIVAGAPATATFTTQPAGANEGAAFTTQPAVTIKDTNGNVVPSSPVTLSITTGTGTSGAALTCTSNPMNTDSVGVANFAGCSIDKPGAGYTLKALDGSATITSNAFTVGGPRIISLSINNKTGGTAGTAEAGDTITFTYSAGLKMTSICSTSTLANISSGSITPTAASTTVTLTKNSGATPIAFTSTDCTLHLGSISLPAVYVGGSNGSTLKFAASTIVWNGSNTITVTLGSTVTGTSSNMPTAFTGTLTPDTAITDPSGNAISGTAFTWSAIHF